MSIADSLEQRKIAALHNALTHHDPVTKDMRDKRDPSELGKRLALFPDVAPTYCGVMDAGVFEIEHCPDYPGDESMVTFTVRERKAELESRAAQGDKFAISVLTTGLPGDSDS